jgi:large subunit ribosomal protein L18e
MKRTGPTNPHLRNLIIDLKRLSREQNVKLWKRIAQDLEKPTRQRRAINLSRINRYTKENETIIIPGKVLGSGLLAHKLTIAAYSFSAGAIEKINKVNAKAMYIKDLMKESIKGKGVRIIG